MELHSDRHTWIRHREKNKKGRGCFTLTVLVRSSCLGVRVFYAATVGSWRKIDDVNTGLLAKADN